MRLKVIFKAAANALFAKRSPATPVARGPVTPSTNPKPNRKKPKRVEPTIEDEIAAIRRECELEPDDPDRIDAFDAGTRVGTAKGR